MATPVRRHAFVVIVMLVAGLAACDSGIARPSGPEPVPTPARTASSDSAALTDRLAAIDDAVDRWGAAPDLAGAKRAAEAARNLIVGPDGPDYGDADGDGTIEGATAVGLLPGLEGEAGIATPDAGACVERDILGGSWADPSRRWAILAEAVQAWSPTNNPFPTLPSHPQRIVGWATLALAADDLGDAHEFGGHAHLHIDVATRAATDCSQ